MVAPELVLVETANVLRRLERAKRISSLEATSAHRDAVRLDLGLFPYEPFAPRIWALRDNLTSYDAWYVALAEALACPLATLDVRLSRATGPACEIVTPSAV
jgi:predicted nucleic acid-binding protein